ncbi:hypothetical protein F7725_012217 [Dissostichus mawsoni]|uniref:Uncharacterized protein n=1 Tax=Dissostichus mawsoni TaxID=36200 RepID=A0A7J5YM28_DISMA|nr:hypothetical protein F7725_012217 [Dissostichus mawsoni]
MAHDYEKCVHINTALCDGNLLPVKEFFDNFISRNTEGFHESHKSSYHHLLFITRHPHSLTASLCNHIMPGDHRRTLQFLQIFLIHRGHDLPEQSLTVSAVTRRPEVYSGCNH